MSTNDLVLDGEPANLETIASPDVTQPQGTQEPTRTEVPDWIAENLQVLGRRALSTMTLWGRDINGDANDSQSKLVSGFQRHMEDAMAIYPLLIQLKIQRKKHSYAAKASPLDLEPILLKGCLAHTYGPDLEATGIYEQLATTPELDQLLKYFPEFGVVGSIMSQYVDITSDPFQAIFTIPDLETRAFFTGTLGDSRTQNTVFASGFNYGLFTMSRALPYAKEKRVLDRLSHYMEQLDKGKKAGRQIK